ncbi:MAG: hypothetical protein ACK4MX_05110 [Thermaurantiacus sp.]
MELALVMPVIAALILATFDAAATARRAFEVQTVAQAAASAVARLHLLPPGIGGSGNAGANVPPPNSEGGGGSAQLLPGIDQLVILPQATTGEVRLFWGCGGLRAEPNQQGCGSGIPFAPYVEVHVRGSVPRLVAWPGMLMPAEVEGRALARLG